MRRRDCFLSSASSSVRAGRWSVSASSRSRPSGSVGTIQVGATAFQSVAVTNVGEAQLRLLSVSVVEGDLLLWEVDQQGAPTFNPESTEIVFRFSPVGLQQVAARGCATLPGAADSTSSRRAPRSER